MKALNPPMGWNSWDSYGTTVTEEEVLANAALMDERLKDAGWNTVVVDIAWYDPTAKAHGYNTDAPLVLDEYGRQLPDPARFPSAAGGAGFAPLAERIHAMGLDFGIHVMRGIPRLAVERDLPIKGTSWTARDVVDKEHVCVWNPDNYGLDQSHPGAQAWYDAQVDQFAEWGVDFLKVDDMQTPFHRDEIFAYHQAIERAEQTHGRAITLSLSPGGWLSTTHVDFLRQVAQMWRISDDLWDRWDDIKAQFARLARWAPFQQTGHWADADMLPLGHIGLRAERGDDRQCALSEEEQRTLLTLWCMGRSPLMVGGDLPTSDEKTLRLLANPALREVSAGSVHNAEIIREPLADVWGESTEHAGEYIVWRADAADWGNGVATAHPGGVYAALFWTGNDPKQVRVALSSLVGLERSGKQWRIRDLWHGEGESSVHLEGEGAYRDLVAQLAPHGVAWLVLEASE